MIGTFGGALEARKINASNGRLRAEVRGEIESDQGVLVIRRVHVHFFLDETELVRDTVERVHRVYADNCPVYKTLRPSVAKTSEFELRTIHTPEVIRCRFIKSWTCLKHNAKLEVR